MACMILKLILGLHAPRLAQFYDKFQIRANILDLLEYLWEVPSHRRAWIAVCPAPGSLLGLSACGKSRQQLGALV